MAICELCGESLACLTIDGRWQSSANYYAGVPVCDACIDTISSDLSCECPRDFHAPRLGRANADCELPFSDVAIAEVVMDQLRARREQRAAAQHQSRLAILFVQ